MSNLNNLGNAANSNNTNNYNSKYEFLAALEKELERYGVVDKDDILTDFELHFTDSKKQGLTDAEICERLGKVSEIAKQYATDEVLPEQEKKADASEKTVFETETEKDDGTVVYTKDFTSGFNDVRIGVIVAKTNIICSPDDTARVRYTNNRPGMRFSAEIIGDTLEINEKSRGFSFWLFGFINHHSELYIELPKKIFTSFNFNTVSGGAEIFGVRSEYMNVNSTSGTVDMKAHAERINLSSISGKLIFENCTNLPSNLLEIHTTSGRTNIHGIKPQNYSLNAVSGHINITGFSGTGKINLTSGHATLGFDEWNGGLNVSVVSGWVDVTLPENSGVNLNISKVSGYVKYDICGDTGRCGKNGHYTFGGENKQYANVSLTSGHVGFTGNF